MTIGKFEGKGKGVKTGESYSPIVPEGEGITKGESYPSVPLEKESQMKLDFEKTIPPTSPKESLIQQLRNKVIELFNK